ncbi:ABC transporter ATP-binding protein [Clostridium sp.]|uniref:ABC transporter ATP-binding protein n=1 Tax=Clostridium sp. TaxID=1506 RepID=UPI003D6D2D56
MKQDNGNDFENLLESYKFNNNKPLITLLYMYKGNWGKLLVSIMFFVVKNSPVWIIPIVTANIINIASNPSEYSLSSLRLNLIIAFIAIIQNVPTQMMHIKYLAQPVRYVEAKLRSNLVSKLQILSISYHKELKSGKLQSKVLRDVEAIQLLSMQIYSTILPLVFNITIALIITVTKSPMMALFFFITLPTALIFTGLFRKNIRTSNTDFRKEIEEMSANVAEMVEMVPVTRAHGLENVEIEKMQLQLNLVKSKGYHLDLINAFFGASSWVVFQVFQVISLGFTGYQAYMGRITIGEVVLYQGYFTSILNQVANVMNTYPILVKGMESISSVGEILTANDVENNKGKVKVKSVSGDINFENVEFSYGDSKEPVLKDFNLHVKKGECIAFVGESGAGKSTILNLIVGFNSPTKGRILLDGVDMSELDLTSYRKFIAVVPQNTLLFSGTLRENITYGLSSVDDEKLDVIMEYANIKEFTSKLPGGIDTQVGEHGGKLSGGQRQRIAIARALIRDPQIIMLDEATSALDNISELQVQKAMNNLIKGRTTFIVAHRLSTIRDADKIAVMSNGICVEFGTYDELVARQGEFYKLKKLQL